jgi:hypothetical protein
VFADRERELEQRPARRCLHRGNSPLGVIK